MRVALRGALLSALIIAAIIFIMTGNVLAAGTMIVGSLFTLAMQEGLLQTCDAYFAR